MLKTMETLATQKNGQAADKAASVTNSGHSSSLPKMLTHAPQASESVPIAPLERPAIKLGRMVASLASNCLGLVSVGLTLAIISAVPVLNLLSLGYLLESSGRVARSGRLRDGLIGLSDFSKLGRMVISCWIWILPLRLVHSYWRDAELIAAGSPEALRLRIFLVFLSLAVGAHLIHACLRGGKWRHFFLPSPFHLFRALRADIDYAELIGRISAYLKGMRLAYYFSLGLRGFCGAALWLACPLMIIIYFGNIANPGIAVLGSLLGSAILAGVCLYLPFLQTRFAMTGNFSEFYSIRPTRELFERAPLAFWMALFVTLLFALPLYLLKIELTPNEIAWLPNIAFVFFIFPARLLLGWAVSRAERRETRRIWLWRWGARLGAIPVAGTYAFIVWLTQYLSWHGSLSLLEQHAFLVPAPLFGL